MSESTADSQNAQSPAPDPFERLFSEMKAMSSEMKAMSSDMKALEGRLSQQIAGVQKQIADLQEDVQALRDESDKHDRELGLLSVQASIDRERATRGARRGDYREEPRRPPVPSQTEPAVSGFSFDPSVRKPATPRYG